MSFDIGRGFDYFEGEPMGYPVPEKIDDASPSRETRRMWPDDMRLRAAGWKIADRPRTGPAWWAKDGQLLTEQEALDTINQLPIDAPEY